MSLSVLRLSLASASGSTILGAIAVGVAWLLYEFRASNKHDKIASSWTHFAASNGWLSSPVELRLVAIHAELKQIKLTVYPHLSTLGKHHSPYTHVIAALPSPSTFFIKLHAKEARAHHISTSDFDERYDIESNHETLSLLWLDEHHKKRIMEVRPYEFYLNNNEVLLVRAGLEEDTAQLKSAIQTAAALASRGLSISQGWSSLASALGAERTEQHQIPEAGLSELRVEYCGVVFLLWVGSTQQRGLTTVISTNHATSLRLHLGQAAAPEGLSQRLQGLPLLSLEANLSGVHLALRGLVCAVEVVQLALRVCAEICSQTQGPYR